MKTPGEIPVLDNLRAIAAWSVCLYHFVCATVGFINSKVVYDIFYYGQFGVHLFFIISGMVIPWSLYRNSYRIKNLFGFLLKRLLRLEPPYLFSILLAIAFIYLRKYSPSFDGMEKTITVRQVFLHLGYLVPFFNDVSWLNNVYWTLAIEFQYYLLIGLLYFLFISPMILLRFLGYGVLLATPFVFADERFLPFWLPLFGIGILLFLFKSKQIGIAELAVASTIFIGHLFFFNSGVCAGIALVTEMIILFMFSYSNPLLAFLGKFSYSVYLMHTLAGAAFVNVLSHYVTGNFAKLVLVLGGLVVTAASSYVMYIVIEKPSKKLSSGVKYNR
ncbi:MAG TPA: acyltransferase [Bacteroidia bacterium]|nr:acyltransferase [Bacteroidia bacterium]